ncbi:MAG: hypothetical protein ACFN4D_01155, partial [Cardiobacterium sp.]
IALVPFGKIVGQDRSYPDSECYWFNSHSRKRTKKITTQPVLFPPFWSDASSLSAGESNCAMNASMATNAT